MQRAVHQQVGVVVGSGMPSSAASFATTGAQHQVGITTGSCA
jgi:hypothetical protein